MESAHRPHLLLLLLLLLFSILCSPVVATPPHPANFLFILGDSTCISGSRHRLLPDLIADRMALPPLPSFFETAMIRNITNATLAGGINFGSAPARIITAGDATIEVNGERLFLQQSLSQQVRQVHEALQVVYLEAGPEAGDRVVGSVVVLMSFGSDEYVEMFEIGGPRAVGIKFGRRGFARVLVTQMERAVKNLYNEGVRKIAVMGVGPMGYAPRILWDGRRRLHGRNCIEEVNEVVSSYNDKLAKRLLNLQSKLSGLQIVFCDINQGMMEIISNSHTYGFSSVKNACCGVGDFGAMIGCQNLEMSCSDPSSHIWWDFYSTTEAVNLLLANWSWLPPESRLQICQPIDLHQLVHIRKVMRHGDYLNSSCYYHFLGCMLLIVLLCTVATREQ